MEALTEERKGLKLQSTDKQTQIFKNIIAQHVVAKSNERIKSALKEKQLKPSLTFASSPFDKSSLSDAQKEVIIFLREILSKVSFKLMKIINLESIDPSSEIRKNLI